MNIQRSPVGRAVGSNSEVEKICKISLLSRKKETFGNNHESIMALPNKAKRLNCDSWSHGTMTIRICDVVWHHDDLMASFKYLLCLR